MACTGPSTKVIRGHNLPPLSKALSMLDNHQQNKTQFSPKGVSVDILTTPQGRAGIKHKTNSMVFLHFLSHFTLFGLFFCLIGLLIVLFSVSVFCVVSGCFLFCFWVFKRKKKQSWVAREVGRIWEELGIGGGKNNKNYCMKILSNIKRKLSRISRQHQL